MLFGDTVCEHEGSASLLFLNLPGTGVWPVLSPCSPNILGSAMLAWCTLSSGKVVGLEADKELPPTRAPLSPPSRRLRQRSCSWVLFLTASISPYPNPFPPAAS